MRNVVMDHYRNPRNSQDLSWMNEEHQYENPSCGDWIRLLIEEKAGSTDGVTISFQAEGCSLCIAAASMLCSFMDGRSREEARRKAKEFIALFKNNDTDFSDTSWGELAVFEEIRRFPVRQRCVTLPFNAFIAETAKS